MKEVAILWATNLCLQFYDRILGGSMTLHDSIFSDRLFRPYYVVTLC